MKVTGNLRRSHVPVESIMSKLHLADNLSLPIEAITQTFGVLGMRGSGKSNAAVVLAEELFRVGLHWVAIDPKGDWWGVRSSMDGKDPGLPVVVFGGRHADVPLEPNSGPLVADMVIDQTMTCVIDLSEFTEGEKIRFLAGQGRDDGFAYRLYRRKSEDQPPTHLFLEEADDYLPQKAMRDKAKLLHDCTKLFLWGRSRGVGGTLITQRSARLHKDALSQIGTLVVFRTGDPRDQKAILDWVKYHGQSEEVMESLSGLGDGECWVWSPGLRAFWPIFGVAPESNVVRRRHCTRFINLSHSIF
jgi:DNA helicase HerA-like ATPase